MNLSLQTLTDVLPLLWRFVVSSSFLIIERAGRRRRSEFRMTSKRSASCDGSRTGID
jgi:hypothetical protein